MKSITTDVKNHTDLLNYIAEVIGAKPYLEIGTNNCKNFNSIAVTHKMGVDPDLTSPCAIHKTSDDFFAGLNVLADLVFIDGLHEAEQVKRDIENSWRCLNGNGVIVVHDCNPSSKEIATYPRETKEWCGTVWQAAAALKNDKFTIDFDYGCMVIKKTQGDIEFGPFPTWEQFDADRGRMLNLIDLEEGFQIIDLWQTKT